MRCKCVDHALQLFYEFRLPLGVRHVTLIIWIICLSRRYSTTCWASRGTRSWSPKNRTALSVLNSFVHVLCVMLQRVFTKNALKYPVPFVLCLLAEHKAAETQQVSHNRVFAPFGQMGVQNHGFNPCILGFSAQGTIFKRLLSFVYPFRAGVPAYIHPRTKVYDSKQSQVYTYSCSWRERKTNSTCELLRPHFLNFVSWWTMVAAWRFLR